MAKKRTEPNLLNISRFFFHGNSKNKIKNEENKGKTKLLDRKWRRS